MADVCRDVNTTIFLTVGCQFCYTHVSPTTSKQLNSVYEHILLLPSFSLFVAWVPHPTTTSMPAPPVP